MKSKPTIALLVVSFFLGACQTDNWGDGETFGTFGGAAAGGLVGNAIGHGSAGGTLLGVLLGGFVGNQFGGIVDDEDRRRANTAAQQAYIMPVGKQITWNNPQNGNSGTITPVQDGYTTNGAYCREFQQSIIVGGQQQQGYGTACQQPDGSWKIVQ